MICRKKLFSLVHSVASDSKLLGSKLRILYCMPCYVNEKTCFWVLQNRCTQTSSIYSKDRSMKISELKNVETEELYLFGKELIKNADNNELTPDELERYLNRVNKILYQLYSIKDEKYLLKYFGLLSSHSLLSEAAYTIMMRHYADQNDFENVKRLYDDMCSCDSTHEHSRSFVPLVVVCLRTGNFKLAFTYLNKMMDSMIVKYQDNFVQEILVTCVQISNHDNRVLVSSFVDHVFSLLEEYGTSEPKEKTINAISEWFKRDSLNSWKVETSRINERGVCLSCNTRLKAASIPSARLVKLKRNLLTLVKASILHKQRARITDVKRSKTSSNLKGKVQSKSKYFEYYDILKMPSTERKTISKHDVNNMPPLLDTGQGLAGKHLEILSDLKTHLDVNGPFDIVIDALNVGYFSNGFDPAQVRDLIQFFTNQDKKILILCAGILKKELLTTDNVAPANKRIQNLMLFLNRNCSLFFVGSSVVDDYYILYTLIHHNFNIQLVSRDLFRDHLFHLEADNVVDFRKWQQANQYIMRSVKGDGTPNFKKLTTYCRSMQRYENGWHIPVSDDSCLCVSKC